ncbi:flagellin-like hook-associated protein FlgL [Nitrospirillum amazonense]|uniref:Flagellin-like hook-associated protein FlgL n=1 Tax=Nitrospirillum amazonense TaxID=28077 RepID=A0A560FH47_9PROT|nr:flagellin [Nitrospirillum amazonense]TWB20914.1 flagellin-like hook-associated protein FlgL [Nitrospirillum amazonense]
MSSQVALSSAMRSNLLLLQNTNSSIDKLQAQLSTGNKVNSALDGPTAFFAAQGLNQRASDLSTLKDAMGQAISTIKAGNQGITSIQKLIDQAKGLTTSAYSNLGNDPSAIATRKSLADQFNDIKDQIDKLAADSGYGGKNLLAGSGQTFDATSLSRSTVNSITGLSNSRVTNVTTSDTYSVRVSGTGDISGNAGDIASAEDARGLFGLKVSGKLSSTAGNFSDVSIEIRGAVGQTRTAVITEGGESRSITFFDNTQSATNSLVSAGTSGTPQISQVNITGNIDEGDTFNVTINGRTFSYTASAGDVSNPSPTTRQAAIATNLQSLINNSLPGSAFSGFTIGPVTGSSFQITAASSFGTSNSFTLGSSTVNALTKDISVSFTSGSVVSFTVDRSTLEGLGTAGNGTSTIEKDVDLAVTATDLNGVSITRSGANDRGSGKLTDGENAMSFTTGTVRINVDSTKIMQAASANRSANMTTSQQTPANTQNDLSVQFNETNTNSLSVKSTNVTTDGQGLRLDYAQNDFLDRSDIDAAVAQLTYATTQLRSAGQTLSTNLNVIQTRSDFTDAFNNVLSDGADSLVQVDQNQAGAELLTLQTRQSLGVTTLSLANQSQQAILKLF